MSTLHMIGVGSPIVDLLAQVDDTFIDEIEGDKGGMVLVDAAKMDALISKLDKSKVKIAPGGSAANTTFAISRLGLKTGLLGKLGRDENAHYYKDTYKQAGGSADNFKYNSDIATARCLSLITPDAERTMRTDLGAASTLDPHDISETDFIHARHIHVEGYLLFKANLLEHVLEMAKNAGCTISLDLGSFEVVKGSIDLLPNILKKYITIVFANEEEAEAFAGTGDDQKNLEVLSGYCELAAVKLGKKGAIIKSGSETVSVKPLLVENPVDTTAAGDFWAAGFLYGYLKGEKLERCGEYGSLLGAEVIQTLGTALSDETWETIKGRLS